MEPRVIVTVNAKHRAEALAALELVMDKIKKLPRNDSVEERVEMECEGFPELQR